MAIATATALAIGGMAISAGTAGASFAQAGKQRQLQKQAENDASQALEEARKRTEVNVYGQLGINKEPYALEREALLSAGATGMQAAMEGDERGVAAAAGRIQAAQNEAQAGVTTAMSQEMSNLDKLKAQEEARLMNVNLELDKGQILGSQQAASDAGNAAAAATQAGFASLAAGAKQGLETFVPLFGTQAAPGGPNTSLQAMAQQQGLGGSYTAPKFQTNPAFMSGVDPFAINPAINYPTAPVGFNRGAPLPFGGGNQLNNNATFTGYTTQQPYMMQAAGNSVAFNPSKYYK